MSRMIPTLAAFLSALAIIASPANAAGKLNIVGTFINDDTEIAIATYVEVDDKDVEQRVALFSVRVGQRQNAAAFDVNEWPTFVTLVRGAEASQSSTWHPVGEFKGTGTSDVSRLRVSAGPGMRIVVESPAKGAFTSDLPAARFSEFEAAISKVDAFLHPVR